MSCRPYYHRPGISYYSVEEETGEAHWSPLSRDPIPICSCKWTAGHQASSDTRVGTRKGTKLPLSTEATDRSQQSGTPTQ